MAKEQSYGDLEELSEAFELFIEERTPTAQCKKWQKKFKRRVHRITRYGLFSIKNLCSLIGLGLPLRTLIGRAPEIRLHLRPNIDP